MKRGKKIFRGILIVIAFLLITFSIYDFSNRLDLILKEKTYRALTEISAQNKDIFVNKINQQLQILEATGKSILSIEGIDEIEIPKALSVAAQTCGFDKMYSASPKGVVIRKDGGEENIASKDYFKEAMKGKQVVTIPRDEKGNIQNAVVLAVPLYKDGEITRIVCGLYSLERADKVLMQTSYYGEGYGFIATADGELLLGINNEKRLSTETNLFDFFAQAEFKNKYSLERLREEINAGNSGTFAISYNGKERFASFAPTGINGWYCLTFATNVVMQKEMTEVSRIVYLLAIKIMLCFSGVAVYVILIKRKHNKRIKEANQEYESLLANVRGGVLRSKIPNKTEDMQVIYISEGFTKVTGYTMEDLEERFEKKFCRCIYSEDVESTVKEYEKQVAENRSYDLQYRIICKDGSIRWIMDTGRILNGMDEETNQSILVDITQIKEQEAALKLSEERFRIATMLSSGTIFEYDFTKNEFTHFENCMLIFGVSNEKLKEISDELLKRTNNQKAAIEFFYHEDDILMILKEREKMKEGNAVQYEARVRQDNGNYIWCRIFLYPILDERGKLVRYVCHIMDIQKEKNQMEELKEQAQQDLLTGVYNKVSTEVMSNMLIEKNHYKKHALLMIDIDDFKVVNDTLGHACGDEVLKGVSAGLKQIVDSEDIVGRIGGDEFAIFIANAEEEKTVIHKAEKICEMFANHYAGEFKRHKISCSIGIAFSEGKKNFRELFKLADVALYRAKAKGKDGYSVYEEGKTKL